MRRFQRSAAWAVARARPEPCGAAFFCTARPAKRAVRGWPRWAVMRQRVEGGSDRIARTGTGGPGVAELPGVRERGSVSPRSNKANPSLQVEIDGAKIPVLRKCHSFEEFKFGSVFLDQWNRMLTKIVAPAGVKISNERPIGRVFFRCSSFDHACNMLV